VIRQEGLKALKDKLGYVNKIALSNFTGIRRPSQPHKTA